MENKYSIYSGNLENWKTFRTQKEARAELAKLSQNNPGSECHFHKRAGGEETCLKIINKKTE